MLARCVWRDRGAYRPELRGKRHDASLNLRPKARPPGQHLTLLGAAIPGAAMVDKQTKFLKMCRIDIRYTW